MHTLLACTFFVLVGNFLFTSVTSLPEKVEFLIEHEEQIVTRLAENVTSLFESRRRYLINCECSRHACTNDMTGYTCSEKLGTKPDTCGKTCPGRLINFKSSIFRTPPNVDIRRLSTRLKESICLYSNLEPAMKELLSDTSPSWLYFGGVDGSHRIYPSAGRARGLDARDKVLRGCRKYDPRIRPWFIGASSRPKDIVLVIDISKSMDDLTSDDGDETRWDLTSRAVLSMLDTLASFDYVNVVVFNDFAARLGTESSLLEGSAENLAFLKKKVQLQYPSGSTNFDDAFHEAFDILTNACDEGNQKKQTCSGCQKIILFLTDGRDTTYSHGTSIPVTTMLEKIEGYQRKLERATSTRASIFTFSMGEKADDSIPRHIACANNGSWAFIGADIDPLTAMNSYYHFLTNYDQDSSPVWINPYEDDGGLGIITTVAKPVYSRGNEELDGVFLGVAAHDVFLKELTVPGVPPAQILEELLVRSETCKKSRQTQCQLQVNRNAYSNKAVCVDLISSKTETHDLSSANALLDDGDCFQGPRKFYKLFQDTESWDKAREICQVEKGRLAIVQEEAELEILAGISAPDGSWIGALRNRKTLDIEWIHSDGNNEQLSDESEYWGIGEPNNNKGIEDCVRIDRRGANGNLNDANCDERRTFICEFTSDTPCENVIKIPKQGYFAIPPLDACVHEEAALRNARPDPYARRLFSKNVVCPLGDDEKTTEEVICCPTCLE